MSSYRLTRAAEKDVRDIARYTLKTWGVDQARRYGENLEAHFEAIAQGEVRLRNVTPTWPDLYVSRCEHHYVFTLRAAQEKPVMIAILHERMDMLRHIEKRLKDSD